MDRTCTAPPADVAALREWVGDDLELLDEVAGDFAAQVPVWLAGLAEALRTGNGEALRRVAHSLKGAVGNFGAPAVREPAAALEELGKAGRLAEAPEFLIRLDPALWELAAFLAEKPWHRRNPELSPPRHQDTTRPC
jgi:two-component system, sensor histidine kinase and response regulator